MSFEWRVLSLWSVTIPVSLMGLTRPCCDSSLGTRGCGQKNADLDQGICRQRGAVGEHLARAITMGKISAARGEGYPRDHG